MIREDWRVTPDGQLIDPKMMEEAEKTIKEIIEGVKRLWRSVVDAVKSILGELQEKENNRFWGKTIRSEKLLEIESQVWDRTPVHKRARSDC